MAAADGHAVSADKPAGGDYFPERFSMREDRPFPGAPENREPAPELPKNTLSMDELRAVYERSNSLAELQAEARAYEEAQARVAGSSESPGPGSPDSASAGEGRAEVGGDGTGHLGARPGVQGAGVDGSARADQPEDVSPLPGAPEDREPALALPDNTPSVDDLRAMHQKARSSAELEAMAPEYAAAQKESSVPGPGREQVLDGQNGFCGRPGDLQDQDATEPGERDVDERTGPDTGTSADTLPQPNRGEKPSDEKDSGGQDDDGQDQQTKDLVQVQHQAPDTEIGRPAEAASEAVPDQQPDDPRLAAMARQMERMMATVEAMQEKLEASEARNDALEAKTVQLEQELDELKTSQAERRPETGILGEDAEQPEYRDPSESAEASEHWETLVLREEADPEGTGLVDERAAVGDSRDELLVQEETERRGYTEETKKVLTSGWGLLKAAGMSVPGADLVLGGQETREAFEELPADQQYQVMRMGETAGLAFSSMPPETAVVALGISLAGPAIREKFADIADRWRRKD